MFSATPVITLPNSPSALGKSTPVTVHISDPHGIRSARSWIEQNGARYLVWEVNLPSRRIFWSRGQADTEWKFDAGTRNASQLKDGRAQLIVEAKSNDFRAKTATLEREVTIVTQPAVVSADQDQHYLYLGMADLVTLNLSGYWTEAGVRVGDERFRAWPVPDGKPGYFSLFAFAWDMRPGTAPVVYATNPAGNEVKVLMVFQFTWNEQPSYRVLVF